MKGTAHQRELARLRCLRYRARKDGRIPPLHPVEPWTWKCPLCLVGACWSHITTFPVTVYADGARVLTMQECECGHGR